MSSSRNDGLQIIGGGLMRTGTFSLHVALERLLGGKCYHMKRVIDNPHHINFWIRACQEDPSDEEWRDFFKDYTAAVDFPQVAFYERLMEVYPDAKVVLTVRDPEKWFQSVNNTIAKVFNQMKTFPTNLVCYLTGKGSFVRLNEMMLTKLFRFDLTKKFADRAVMLEVYEDHVAKMKKIVPSERLLVFQVADGWQPLCDFLEVPVPDEPFPRMNSTEDFQFTAKKSFSFSSAVLTTGAVLLIAFGCYLRYRS